MSDNHTFSRYLSLRQLALLVFLLFPIQETAAMEKQDSLEKAEIIRARTLSGLQTFYQTLDYDWKQLDRGVPPFMLERFPQDLNHATSMTAKKHAFFMGLLPMVLLVNQEITEQRETFIQILDRNNNQELSAEERELLETIANAYRLRGNPLTNHRIQELLLKRIDIIPPSLVLAQAANESAWGTSRFAQLGNNLFGEWTYKTGTGIVPAGRASGETYEVKKFPTIYAAIHSYMRNLNTNGAYRKLREIRADLRQKEQSITGTALALGLAKYSQRGEAYIEEIQAMIRQNNLSVANKTFLRTEKLNSTSTSGSGLLSSRNRTLGHLSPSPQETL